MRVLLTTDTVGGVWTFTKELVGQLLMRGDNVALVSFGRKPSPEQSTWAGELEAHNQGIFQFHACDAPLEWMQNNEATWKRGCGLLEYVADSFGPDIFHSSQFCWGALALEVPKLITAHSDVRSWSEACCTNRPVQSRWLKRYVRLVQDGIDCADATVAPTAWMRKALLEHFEVASPFHVIANGRTAPSGTFQRRRAVRAVSVGRLWDKGKGLDILNQARLPMPLLLAGENSFEDATSGMSQPGIQTLGRLDEKSLFDLFCTSSVYLATSVYEPFGLAPLEAALCGCAIVARDITTFREVWGDAALYFEDATELQDLFCRLMDNPRELRRLRAAARERAQQFTAQSMADAYTSLYRELIAHSSCDKAKAKEDLHAA